MKLRPHLEIFEKIGIILDGSCGEFSGVFKGRNLRYLENKGIVEIGDNNFDRWANSIEFVFEVWLSKGQRQFMRWAKEFNQ